VNGNTIKYNAGEGVNFYMQVFKKENTKTVENAISEIIQKE
jgi:hypothetical protein